MKIPEDYFERVYAGWLGKIIGIRLGAPIEGWSYERIRDVYGELNGYPVSYKNFAADDDSNGPLFFIRALEDCKDINSFSSSDVANALLNYAPYEHGFFWWGGYGISTEHTAYLNLRNQIPAPRSGSIEQNGSVAAQQIGGQIFIDSWGLVAPGNPQLASELAAKAAGVTHDGNGIYGGVFIACCISLAFVISDIGNIIDTALKYIPDDCEYAVVVKAVVDFYDKSPRDWRECFSFLNANFGYDKYPGNCHIIPNAGVIILALLYGEGDYSKAVNICNMCGWDTDCNVGNVGCIMGVLTGIDGIDYDKYAAPINDFLASSSVVGSLNVTDLPYGASYFARLAYLLSGESIPEKWKFILTDKIDSCHFEYPASTHAIRGRCSSGYHIRNTGEEFCTGSRSLKLSVFSASSGEENFFYKQTYYRPEDFDDARYDPEFSPLVYPGQTVHMTVKLHPGENGMQPFALPYVRLGRSNKLIRGEKATVAGCWQELSLRIPGGLDDYVKEVGLILGTAAKGFASSPLTAYLDNLYIRGTPNYRLDFSKETIEHWPGPNKAVSQFTRLKGLYYLENEYLNLSCCDFAEMYTGRHDWSDYELEGTIQGVSGENCFMNVRVQGAMRSYAAGFSDGKLVLMKNLNGYSKLCEASLAYEQSREYRLKITAHGNTISVSANGDRLINYTDTESPILSGAIGVSVRKGSHCKYRDFSVRGITGE